MLERYWEFESRVVVVPETQVQSVRDKIVPLLPTTFCSDKRFRSDGYPDNLVACVLDSIGSVGVRYTNVVKCLEKYKVYCTNHFGTVPTTPRDFLTNFASVLDNPDALAGAIWTRHRTSTRGGILKVEAMTRWLSILDSFGIQTPKDLVAQIDNRSLKSALLEVPGQSRYVSLIYFFMLAGYRDGVKDDRMIQRWFEEECSITVSTPEKAAILMIIADELRKQFPCLTAAELDHLIWLVASGRWSPVSGWAS